MNDKYGKRGLPYILNVKIYLIILQKEKISKIPSLILAIYPKMKVKDFDQIRESPVFLKTVTTVCEECYLKISKNIEVGGFYENEAARKFANSRILGTGQLIPNRTKYREKVALRPFFFYAFYYKFT